MVAGHPFVAEGHDLRNVPAWLGVTAYLEQRFGAWTIEGGMGELARALGERLATRKVTVVTGTAVADLVVRDGRAVVGVTTAEGSLDADVVVVAIDPRLLPCALAPYVARTMPAIPPVVAHVGLEGAARQAARDAARDGAARRADARGPHRRRPPRRGSTPGPCTAAASSSRTSWWLSLGTASTCAPTSSSGSTSTRARWSSSGAARRWGCCGRAARRCGTGSARETPDRRRLRRRCPRHAGQRHPVRRALGRPGRAGGRRGVRFTGYPLVLLLPAET